MAYRNVIFPLLGEGNTNRYATGISMTMDDSFIISCYLTNKNGQMIGTEQTIDLPLESVVVSGTYDSQTKSLVLTLESGNTITIPVGDLVSGLQETIDSNNPLNVDYTTDGTTNKVYTAAEQSKLSGIAAGAEVNVQSDWNESDNTSDAYIANKPTIPAAQIQSDWDQTTTTSLDYIKNKPTLGTMAVESASDYTKTSGLATVATSGSYNDLSNKPTIPVVNDATITFEDSNHTTIDSFSLNQSGNKTITIPSGGGAIDIMDMTQVELLDFYTNYATRVTENTYVVGGYSFSTLTVSDQQYGNILILEYNPQFKDQAAGAAAGTIDVTVGVVYIFADGTKQTTTMTYNVPRTNSLATVATSGSYNDLLNRPNMSTETLTFIDANNVSTTVVVYTQPQI